METTMLDVNSICESIYNELPPREFKHSEYLISVSKQLKKPYEIETRKNTYTKYELKQIVKQYLDNKKIIKLMFRFCEQDYEHGHAKYNYYDKYGFYIKFHNLNKISLDPEEYRLYHEAKLTGDVISSVLFYLNESPRDLEDTKLKDSIKKLIKNYIELCDREHKKYYQRLKIISRQVKYFNVKLTGKINKMRGIGVKFEFD